MISRSRMGSITLPQELVDGINLKQALDQRGECSRSINASSVLRGCLPGHFVGRSSERCHHRDIKPEISCPVVRGHNAMKVDGFPGWLRNADANRIRAREPDACRFDVGATRDTESRNQIQGHTVTRGVRFVIHSGVTMYHRCSPGPPPFDAEEPLALAIKHLHETPRSDRIMSGRPPICPAVAGFARDALPAKEPGSRRFDSARIVGRRRCPMNRRCGGSDQSDRIVCEVAA